jgi:ferredoxin
MHQRSDINMQQIHAIYFSPTGTTRTIAEHVISGMGAAEVAYHDLTRTNQDCSLSLESGCAVIAVPVYAGRVPELFLKRIASLSGRGIPAVLLVLFGNRAFEDALVELRDVITAKGFNVLAAGAFIGEHSFSTADRPIAQNRPDAEDIRKAGELGKAIAGKLRDAHSDAPVAIPGNIPYKSRVPLGGISPQTNPAQCTRCDSCARVCPAFVISVADAILTEAGGCILCSACVRACPQSARTLEHPMVAERRDMLVKNCSERREPVWFV